MKSSDLQWLYPRERLTNISEMYLREAYSVSIEKRNEEERNDLCRERQKKAEKRESRKQKGEEQRREKALQKHESQREGMQATMWRERKRIQSIFYTSSLIERKLICLFGGCPYNEEKKPSKRNCASFSPSVSPRLKLATYSAIFCSWLERNG